MLMQAGHVNVISKSLSKHEKQYPWLTQTSNICVTGFKPSWSLLVVIITANFSCGSFYSFTDFLESPAIEDWVQRGVQEYKSLGEFCCQEREVSCFVAVSENKEDKIGQIAECVNQANVKQS